MQSHSKSERLEARITLEQKRQIEHAANLLGRSITDFTISSLQEAATKVIREHEVISLSMRDQKDFIQALLNASDPNQRLLKAKKLFEKKVKNG
jgi:uncharacterized protein (DUF1778 family)